jgi:hypothetical protein
MRNLPARKTLTRSCVLRPVFSAGMKVAGLCYDAAAVRKTNQNVLLTKNTRENLCERRFANLRKINEGGFSVGSLD